MRAWHQRVSTRLIALLLALAGAWVACNGRWADAAPRPLPAELQPRPVLLAPERNAFFDLQALEAPEGADINALGRRALQGTELPRQGWLSWPEDTLWQCQPRERDCAAAWRAQPEMLRGWLQTRAVLGERCERIARAEGLEELVDAPYAASPPPRFASLGACRRWFGVQAVLAATPRQALERFAQADRLIRLQLQGARSLVGVMVGLAQLQMNWQTALDDAAARPDSDRQALLALLAPLPPQVLNPRAWAATEARFMRELVRDMSDRRTDCGQVGNIAERAWCHTGLGLLPELTAQYGDAQWLARLATWPADGLPGCDVLAAPPWRTEPPAWPAWRNSFGRWMLDGPGVGWARYAARALDTELLRRTLHAQLLGQSPPGAVQLTREHGGQRFAACQARLFPGDAAATLRLPLL